MPSPSALFHANPCTNDKRYGAPFLTHTFLHHVTRVDHRHNFSPYNILLYLSSSRPPSELAPFRTEALAFIPQLLLSGVLIPLVVAKRDLATSMMAQTFAFVSFNKVCTSQVSLLSSFPFPSPPIAPLLERMIRG